MTKAVPPPPQEGVPIQQMFELLGGDDDSSLRVGIADRDDRVCLGLAGRTEQGSERTATVSFDDDEALRVGGALITAYFEAKRRQRAHGRV